LINWGKLIKKINCEHCNEKLKYENTSPASMEKGYCHRRQRKYPITQSITVNNVAGNEEFYSILLNRIGEELRFESDWINGVFNVSLDGEKIKLYEVI
jgi:hypothetical protein